MLARFFLSHAIDTSSQLWYTSTIDGSCFFIWSGTHCMDAGIPISDTFYSWIFRLIYGSFPVSFPFSPFLGAGQAVFCTFCRGRLARYRTFITICTRLAYRRYLRASPGGISWSNQTSARQHAPSSCQIKPYFGSMACLDVVACARYTVLVCLLCDVASDQR